MDRHELSTISSVPDATGPHIASMPLEVTMHPTEAQQRPTHFQSGLQQASALLGFAMQRHVQPSITHDSSQPNQRSPWVNLSSLDGSSASADTMTYGDVYPRPNDLTQSHMRPMPYSRASLALLSQPHLPRRMPYIAPRMDNPPRTNQPAHFPTILSVRSTSYATSSTNSMEPPQEISRLSKPSRKSVVMPPLVARPHVRMKGPKHPGPPSKPKPWTQFLHQFRVELRPPLALDAGSAMRTRRSSSIDSAASFSAETPGLDDQLHKAPQSRQSTYDMNMDVDAELVVLSEATRHGNNRSLQYDAKRLRPLGCLTTVEEDIAALLYPPPRRDRRRDISTSPERTLDESETHDFEMVTDSDFNPEELSDSIDPPSQSRTPATTVNEDMGKPIEPSTHKQTPNASPTGTDQSPYGIVTGSNEYNIDDNMSGLANLVSLSDVLVKSETEDSDIGLSWSGWQPAYASSPVPQVTSKPRRTRRPKDMDIPEPLQRDSLFFCQAQQCLDHPGFKAKGAYTKHVQLSLGHNPEAQFVCPVQGCKRRYTWHRRDLQRHMEQAHPEIKKEDSGKVYTT